MMDGATIAAMSREQAQRAAKAHMTPLVVESEDLANIREHIRRIPNLGDYRPKGWKLVNTFFVDASGFGRDDEPAMTFERFCAKVREAGPGFGYGLIEEGEFQVYVGQFTPVKVRKVAAAKSSGMFASAT